MLGSILTAIATSKDTAWANGLLVTYAIGAAVPMLAIVYGGQAVTTRVRSFARIAPRLQQGFGAVAVALIASCLAAGTIPFVSGEAPRDLAVPLAVAAAQDTAPDFVGITNWFDSAPLDIASLRGKVVLVDFWTYGYVNCVNTLPHATALCSKTGNAHNNQYWPAQYIIDQNGKIVFQHAGEGQYEQIERTIAGLLNANSRAGAVKRPYYRCIRRARLIPEAMMGGQRCSKAGTP